MLRAQKQKDLISPLSELGKVPKDGFCNMLAEFQIRGHVNKERHSPFLTLIPIVPTSVDLNKYRPIISRLCL